jgi:flagellar protein FlaG
MVNRTGQALWQDYRFLTKEMMKFLTKQEMDIFYDLLNQRKRLQAIIDQIADDGFKVSSQGRSLLSEIQQDNQDITDSMQHLLSRSKRHHQVSEAYGAAGTVAVSQMNWKRWFINLEEFAMINPIQPNIQSTTIPVDAFPGQKLERSQDTPRKIVTRMQEIPSAREEIPREDVEKTVEKLNRLMGIIDKRYEYSIHEESHRISVKIVDQQSGEVLAEIPSKRALEIFDSFSQMAGLFFDNRVWLKINVRRWPWLAKCNTKNRMQIRHLVLFIPKGPIEFVEEPI